MKKHKEIAKIGLGFFLLLILCLSGCGEEATMFLPDGTKVVGDFNKVQIASYLITTEKNQNDTNITIGEGFIPTNSSHYRANITVQNIDAKYYITIRVNLYNRTNALLGNGRFHVERTGETLLNSEYHFSVVFQKSEYPDTFTYADHIDFMIYADREL